MLQKMCMDDPRLKVSTCEYQDDVGGHTYAFLRVLAVADEMWLKGTIRRTGPLMFKCFYFIQDNFRIYKYYHDMMKYFEFPNQEMLRDIQICYLEVATLKEQEDLNEYKGLTEHDRKFFELTNLLRIPLMMFNEGISVQAPIKEGELLKFISVGERQLQELIDLRFLMLLNLEFVLENFRQLKISMY